MRILIALDESAHSEAALQLGLQFLRASRSVEMATLLTVIDAESERSAAQQMLARARTEIEAETNRVRTKIRTGYAVEEIVSETTDYKYDLLVIGMRPESGLFRRWLGSTTMQIVERVGCSVAIAKGQIEPLRQILICDSGAHTPSLLHHFVARLGGLLHEEVAITLLHVMSQISAGPGVSGEHLRADADELIREHSPEGQWLLQDLTVLQRTHVQSTPKVRHGFVVDEILDEAQSGDYDLVVIGAHQKEGWTSFLLDNLARQITTQMDRPVLLVR